MTMSGAPTFRYLMLENAWPSLVASGVDVAADGTLTLAHVPTVTDAVTDPLPPMPGLDGPAGIGIDACENLYVADPSGHRILRVDGCDGSIAPLGCIGGKGSGPGQLRDPRGVLVGPRATLYVADSGNARVLLIDLATTQIRGVWDTGFQRPWDLAADSRDFIYIADPGTPGAGGTWTGGQVHKRNASGVVDAAFAAKIAGESIVPGAPVSVAIAVAPGSDDERLLVLDRQPARVIVYTLDGALDAAATTSWSQALSGNALPSAIAAQGGTFYVALAGDAGADGRVLVFGTDGALRGIARSGAGAASGLAIDCRGRLLLHPGGGASVRRALGLPTYAECGTFLLGPYDADTDRARWQRVQVTMDALDEGSGAHLRLFTLTSDALDGSPGNRPSLPMTCDVPLDPALLAADDATLAPVDTWRVAPWDAGDMLALNEPAHFFWIAAILQGDGTASPVLRQIRLTHDEDGWIRYLPALYRRDDASRLLLERLLGGFASVLGEDAALIDDLPLLFDAWAASDASAPPTWLEWLAGWVDATLRETWPDERRRSVVAHAFARHARRGTRESLGELIALYSGATPFIEESFTGVWSLGVTGALGFETTLAALDESAAHHFDVLVRAPDLSGPDGIARLREVIDREKPAHTTYHLCAVGPRMRVGVQARIGIDAIVGGPAEPAPLGAALLGDDSVLAASGFATATTGRVGWAIR